MSGQIYLGKSPEIKYHSKCYFCQVPHERTINVDENNKPTGNKITGRFKPIYTFLHRCLSCGRFVCNECAEIKKSGFIDDFNIDIHICPECNLDLYSDIQVLLNLIDQKIREEDKLNNTENEILNLYNKIKGD